MISVMTIHKEPLTGDVDAPKKEMSE